MADIELVQGDTRPDIEGTLFIPGTTTPIDLTTAESVRFQMRREDARPYAIDAEAEVVDAEDGTVKYELQPGDLVQVGDFIAQWEIHWNNGAIQTTTPANTVEVRRQ